MPRFGTPLALAIAPGGFTVADFTAKVRDMTGQAGYTIRNAACDLRPRLGRTNSGPWYSYTFSSHGRFKIAKVGWLASGGVHRSSS